MKHFQYIGCTMNEEATSKVAIKKSCHFDSLTGKTLQIIENRYVSLRVKPLPTVEFNSIKRVCYVDLQ